MSAEADTRPQARRAEGPLYPEVEVQLSGEDGNAFVMVSRVRSEMRRQGNLDEKTRQEFFAEALSGNYDHVLQTIMKWVTVL